MTIFDWLLLSLYFLTLLTQLYFLKFRSIRKYAIFEQDFRQQQKPFSDTLPCISIIVCARNEAENLSNNLPLLLQQDYPANKWELIIVNDASTDNTSELLQAMKREYPQLRIVSVLNQEKRLFPGKKHALHQGIEAATFDTVLLTDADCRPASAHWLPEMAGTRASTQKPVIMGYGAYEKTNGFLNKMVQWETLQTCIQYTGMSLAGRPYMGVGRNLLYDKKLYFQALEDEAFRKTYTTLPSGDDDLLIGKMANSKNTVVCLSENAHTISLPPKTFRHWFRQKTRHVSTGKYYPTNTKRILGIAALSQGMFWLLWLLIGLRLLWIPMTTLKTIIYLFCLLAGTIRIGLYWRNAKKWYAVLGGGDLVYSYPIGEICLSVFQLLISPYIFWKNKQQWN